MSGPGIANYRRWLRKQREIEENNGIDTDNLPQVIGLYSPVPQSGKSTLASFLTTLGYTWMGHAGPMKAMADTLLRGYLGYSETDIQASRGSLKDQRVKGIDYTRRDIERALGCGLRDRLAADFWIDVLRSRIDNHPGPVVVDDVRFPNEFEAIRKSGGQLWRITRQGSPCWHMAEQDSESLLEDYDFDHWLTNEGTPDSLFQQAGDIIGPLV